MLPSIGNFDAIEELSTLPGRPLRDEDLDELNEADNLEVSVASVLVDSGEIISVFLERDDELQIAGYSPADVTWYVYGEWDDAEKGDD